MNVKYGLVKHDKIIKFKLVDHKDKVIIPKLLAHGYRIVSEKPVPIFDNITQYLTDSYNINIKTIDHNWTVHERVFSQAKKMKEDEVNIKSLSFINDAFSDIEDEEKIKIDKILKDKKKYMGDVDLATTNSDLRKIVMEVSNETKTP